MIIIYRGLGFVVLLFVTIAVVAGNAFQVHLHFNSHVLNIVIVAIFALCCLAFDAIDRYDSTFFFLDVKTWGYLAVLVPLGFYAWHIYQQGLAPADIKAELVEFIHSGPTTPAVGAGAAENPPQSASQASLPPAPNPETGGGAPTEAGSPAAAAGTTPPAAATGADNRPGSAPQSSAPDGESGDAVASSAAAPTPPAAAETTPPPPATNHLIFPLTVGPSPANAADAAPGALPPVSLPVAAAPSTEATPPPNQAKAADASPAAPAALRKPTRFDCGKRSFGVDYVICASDQLLDLEAVLEDAYFAALDTLGDERKSQLHAAQRQWSYQFGVDCGLPARGEPSAAAAAAAKDCVATAMRARIIYLKGLVPPPEPVLPTAAAPPVAPTPAAASNPPVAPDPDDDRAALYLICRGSKADNNEEVVELLTIDERAKSVTIDLSYVGVVLKVVDGAKAQLLSGTYDVPGHPEAGFAQELMVRGMGDAKVPQYFRTEENRFVFGAGKVDMSVDRRSGLFTGLALVPLACEVTDNPNKRRF